MQRNRSCAFASPRAGPRRVLDEPQHGRQRRAQLVADVGHKIAAHLAGGLGGAGVLEGQQHAALKRAGADPVGRVAPRGTMTIVGDLRGAGRQNLFDAVEHGGMAQHGDMVAVPGVAAEKGFGTGVQGGDAQVRADQQQRHRDRAQNCLDPCRGHGPRLSLPRRRRSARRGSRGSAGPDPRRRQRP